MKKQIIFILGLTIASAANFGCSKMQSSTSSGGESSSSSLGGAKEKAPKAAFMSSEQMLKTMISTTGGEGLGELTDPADDLIQSTYQLRTGALPSSQSLSMATGPTLISAANVAAAVCAKAVDRDRATAEAQRDSRLFFKEFDFSLGLAAQDSSAVTKAFTRLARNSWRRSVEKTETDAIVDFAQEFSSGASATDAKQTRFLAISVCTAVLSSIDGLTY